MSMQDAQVTGSQVLLRSALSYDAASRASGGKKAFVKATELLVENMMESVTKRLEIGMLHGGSGLVTAASSSNSSATVTVITATTAAFAAGIWAGSEGTQVNFYNVATLISSAADSIFTITAVDVDARTLTVTGTSTGISALDTAIGANANVIAAYYYGAYGAEMVGLKKIITNTGTLFNINASTYNLWKGNTATVSGALTFGKVLSAVSKAVNRGLNEAVVCLVNPTTWANLASDLAALRRFDDSYSKKEVDSGSESLCYYGQNGKIEVMSHNCVKEGEAFIFPPKKVKRIGSQDVSFKTPGREDEIFLHRPDNAAYELRLYTDQSVFVETPARCIYVTGFVNV